MLLSGMPGGTYLPFCLENSMLFVWYKKEIYQRISLCVCVIIIIMCKTTIKYFILQILIPAGPGIPAYQHTSIHSNSLNEK